MDDQADPVIAEELQAAVRRLAERIEEQAQPERVLGERRAAVASIERMKNTLGKIGGLK